MTTVIDFSISQLNSAEHQVKMLSETIAVTLSQTMNTSRRTQALSPDTLIIVWLCVPTSTHVAVSKISNLPKLS